MINGDTVVEDDEAFTVELSSPINLTLGDDTGEVTVLNNDAPAVSVSDAVVTEIDGGFGWATVSFTLSHPTAKWSRVDYATVDGSATVEDYVARSGSVAFAAGSTVQTRGFMVNGDTELEDDEVFSVVLSAPLNLTLGDDTGVITIINND
jgi:hypothetical protein